MNRLTESIRSVLFGVAVGDALGVPVEFMSREEIARNPLTDMIGYGTYNLPPGTWSDDSSMTFCLAEALSEGFSLHAIGDKFVQWAYFNYWTPRGEVFDIGNATRQAVARLKSGVEPELAGCAGPYDNGNGSLMRILPLLFYMANKPVAERYLITNQVSSITHRHIRSVIACFYYLEFARLIHLGTDPFEAYHRLQSELPQFFGSMSIPPDEIALLSRLLQGNIYQLPAEAIQSSGYVLHTLEAAIWCLLTTHNYSDAVLKAVNLGEDTDTTGAVTGGMAGLLYGLDNIPEQWRNQLARNEDIENLAVRYAQQVNPFSDHG